MMNQPPRSDRIREKRHYIGTVQAATQWLQDVARETQTTLLIRDPLPPGEDGCVTLTAWLGPINGDHATIEMRCRLDAEEIR